MTFTEAALVVLRREGRPMRAKEIANKAIELGLLSHVGKTPVQTMSARLSAMVAKGRGKGDFVRVEPGVFALSDSARARPAPAAPETVPDAAPESVAPARKKKRRRRKRKAEEQPAEAPVEAPSPPSEPRKAKKESHERKKARPRSEQRAQKPKDPRPAAEKPAKLPRASGEEREIPDVAEEILRSETRPVPPRRLAKLVFPTGATSEEILEAFLAADGAEREARGLRPRFVRHRGGWALAEREVSAEIVGLERQVAEAAQRLEKLSEKQVLRRLRSLPFDGFVRVVAMYLTRAGFGSATPVDRGGEGEVHLSVRDRRRRGRFRTAVVVRRGRGAEPIGEEAVTGLRGALHQYGATSAMIVTDGVFTDGARRDADVPNLSPVALVDGETLSTEMVRLGIGVLVRAARLVGLDEDLFSGLGAK